MMTGLASVGKFADVDSLPLVDPTGLSRAQLEGRACVSCHKRFPRPTVPLGRLGTGEVLYRCPECLVTLEPVEPGPDSILATRSESERPR